MTAGLAIGLRGAHADRQPWPPDAGGQTPWTAPRRIAPTAIAAALALAYVLVSPPSLDLAAHMFRAWLFSKEPFGIWNNYWYDGHHIVGYSLLFPAAAAALTPQLVAAIAATGTAALFERLVYRHFGDEAWLGAVVFGAATATDLYTGRLPFAFGALPALAAVVALDRRRPWAASALGTLSALCSPVDALFVALAGGAYAVGRVWSHRRLRPAINGLWLVTASLAPVGFLVIAFPEGGREPFVFSAMWPLPLIAIGILLVTPRRMAALRAGIVIYALGTIVSYLVPTPLGSNVARLGTLLAPPLAALLLWPRRHARIGPRPATLLALAALPLLYLEWQAPIRDLVTASGDPSRSSGYYRPLLSFLKRESVPPTPPFRVEIPFTSFHWEAYAVASRFPIVRGWERQLDIRYNGLFYSGRLTARRYESWLHRNAVRFVAVSDAPLDYAGRAEQRLIDGGLPFLRLVAEVGHWHIYAVRDPTPIAQGVATLTRLGPDWLELYARRPGTALIRVHYTPYWALAEGSGCVVPAGGFTKLTLHRAGPVRLVIRFALSRIAARSPRCT